MASAIRNYLGELVAGVVQGWNRFWFLSSRPDTLSLLRPLLAIIALWWHSSYTADLVALFGPDGIISVETRDAWTGGRYQFSYLQLAGTGGELMALHWVGAVVFALFGLGALTRLTTPLSLVVVLSYINRAPMLTSEVEPVLAMALVYSALGQIFSIAEERPLRGASFIAGGPLAARFSIDSLVFAGKPQEVPAYAAVQQPSERTTSATLASRLIQVHLAAVYLMSALTMFANESWWTGEAVWWLVSRPEERSFAFAPWLAGKPFVVNAWTHAIVGYELLFPLLVWNRLLRPLVLAAGLIVWPLVAIASGAYLFSALMLVVGLVFVSPDFVRSLLPARAAPVRAGAAAANPLEMAGSR